MAALAAGYPIGAAARSVGKTRATAYALRRKSGGEEFAAAWDAALACAQARRAAFVSTPALPPQGLPSGARRMPCDRLFAQLYHDAARAGRGQSGQS